MSRRISPPGEECWRVRVAVTGGMFYLASAIEPTVRIGPDGRIMDIDAVWLKNPDEGDTLGFVDWSAVSAVTWRWSGTKTGGESGPIGS